MARIRTRKSRARHFTPPPDLKHTQKLKHPRTPSRCGVLWAKAFSQELGITIKQDTIQKLTGIPLSGQTRIIASKQVRTLHNIPDSGPDPRGRKRAIIRQDTSAIADYLDDDTVPLDDRGKPWQDIAEDAGVILPKTTHFKPPGLRTVEPRSIRRACKSDEGIINAVCDEEKELLKPQAKERVRFSIKQLLYRPHSEYWRDVCFSDEFHLGIGPQITKRIKRKLGKEYRYKPQNIHRKKVTIKDTKAKAREEGHLNLLSVWIVIRYNYRKIIPYNVSNTVGKMTAKVYTETILPAILDDFTSQGLTLCQDADSAHISKVTTA